MSTEKERREFYAETINYKLLEWYFDIAKKLGDARAAIGVIRDTASTRLDLLADLDVILWDIHGDLDWLQRSLFINTDKEKVKSFDQCMLEALKRPERLPVARGLEGRKSGYLTSRLGLEDRYEALSRQMDNMRDIFAANKWFELSRRPEPKPHGGPSLGVK